MTNRFLRSTDGSNTDDGLSWANAKATYAGVVAGAAAGDVIFVSASHVETAAGFTMTGVALPSIRTVCVDDTGDPVNPTTMGDTAYWTTGTSASNITFTVNNSFYGCRFYCGGTTGGAYIYFGSDAATGMLVFKSCQFHILNTNVASRFSLGNTGGTTYTQRGKFIDCSFRFSSTSQAIICRDGIFEFVSMTLNPAGSIPTTLFIMDTYHCEVLVEASDLTGRAVTNLVGSAGGGGGKVTFRDCKLPANVNIRTGVGHAAGVVIRLHNCDSGATNYRMVEARYQGTVSQDTAIYLDATDGDTPISWSMVSGAARTTLERPLPSPEIAIWNATVGSEITVSIEIVHDSATALQDDEVWLEVLYTGSTTSPVGSIASDRVADVLTTPADQDVSSVAWTGTDGFTNVNRQTLSVTFTPQMKGYLIATVNLALDDKTIYVNPKLTVA